MKGDRINCVCIHASTPNSLTHSLTLFLCSLFCFSLANVTIATVQSFRLDCCLYSFLFFFCSFFLIQNMIFLAYMFYLFHHFVVRFDVQQHSELFPYQAYRRPIKRRKWERKRAATEEKPHGIGWILKVNCCYYCCSINIIKVKRQGYTHTRAYRASKG